MLPTALSPPILSRPCTTILLPSLLSSPSCYSKCLYYYHFKQPCMLPIAPSPSILLYQTLYRQGSFVAFFTFVSQDASIFTTNYYHLITTMYASNSSKFSYSLISDPVPPRLLPRFLPSCPSRCLHYTEACAGSGLRSPQPNSPLLTYLSKWWWMWRFHSGDELLCLRAPRPWLLLLLRSPWQVCFVPFE
jgi:hypothetical protein